MIDEKTQKLVHVQCSTDADNILEDSTLVRTDSIASIESDTKDTAIENTDQTMKDEVMEQQVKTEPIDEKEFTEIKNEEATSAVEMESSITNEEIINAEAIESPITNNENITAEAMESSMTEDIETEKNEVRFVSYKLLYRNLFV